MEVRFLLRTLWRPRISSSYAIRHRQAQSFSHNSNCRTSQANPIGDYYGSILESSAPTIPSPTPTTASTSTSPIETVSVDTAAGPAILFSSRLSSPLERRSEIQKQSTLVAGVWVPPRPDEPDNCCMSGCVNCVWDRYGEELEEWAAATKEADRAMKKNKGFEQVEKRRKGKGSSLGQVGLVLGEGEKGTSHTTVSMDDDGGGSDTNWGTGLEADFTHDDLFKGVPVGIREFMKQEKRLKEKHAREGTIG